jgi:hypothetical protein
MRAGGPYGESRSWRGRAGPPGSRRSPLVAHIPREMTGQQGVAPQGLAAAARQAGQAGRVSYGGRGLRPAPAGAVHDARH